MVDRLGGNHTVKVVHSTDAAIGKEAAKAERLDAKNIAGQEALEKTIRDTGEQLVNTPDDFFDHKDIKPPKRGIRRFFSGTRRSEKKTKALASHAFSGTSNTSSSQTVSKTSSMKDHISNAGVEDAPSLTNRVSEHAPNIPATYKTASLF